MFYLLFLVLSRSEEYTTYIEKDAIGYQTIDSKQYNKAIITVEDGVCILFVDWEDAIVEIGKYKTNKEAGFSLFTFKAQAGYARSFRIYFNSDVSFVYFTIPAIGSSASRFHVSNLNNEEVQIHNTDKNVYFLGVNPYSFNAKFSDNCGKTFHGNGEAVSFNEEINRPNNQNRISIEMGNCASEGKVTISSSITPSVPTSIDADLSTYKNDHEKMYGGTGDSKKEERTGYLENFKYLYVLNNMSIDVAKKVRLTITGEKKSQEIKRGEIFKEASTWYFNAEYRISTKNCGDKNIVQLVAKSARPITLDENNQPFMYVFEDDDIPYGCLDDDDDNSSSNKLSKGGIAGIVIAVIIVVAAVIVVVVIVLKKRKQNHSSQEGNVESKANEV